MMAGLSLDRHETVLILLYRTAPVDVRMRVDGDLFDAWVRMPCSLDSQAPETARYRLAIQRFHAQHVSGQPLAGFVTFWSTKDGA